MSQDPVMQRISDAAKKSGEDPAKVFRQLTGYEPTTDELVELTGLMHPTVPKSHIRKLKLTIEWPDDPTRKPEERDLMVPAGLGKILHLECGVTDVWEPTTEELDEIVNLFADAIEQTTDESSVVVATREGVKPRVLDLT